MTMIMLLALQASPPPSVPAPITPPAKRDCTPAANDGDVVVCAKIEQEQFRLRPIPNRFEKPKTGPGLEFDLGKGAKANVYSTGEMSPDGKPNNKIMAKVRIPF